MGRGGLGLILVMLLAGAAAAQTCNTLSGSPYCGSGLPGIDPAYGGTTERDFSTKRRNDALTPFSGMQSSGTDFVGNDAPATFGAITFSGGGARCGGLFRSGNC
jgi:hypothetical protein